MNAITNAWNSLLAQPMSILMAVIALGCAIVGLGVRGRDRLVLAAMAFIGGVTAWMMATGWRWPH